MKHTLLLPLILFSSMSFAQTAKDYFFPALDKNLSVYKTIDPQGNYENGWTTKIYFKDEGDSAIITTQSNGVSWENDQLVGGKGIWEQSVKINELEILAFEGKTNAFNGVETFNKGGEIIFKIPSAKSEKVEWENQDQKGTMVKTHLSEFSEIKVDGKKRKAVKVTTILKRKRSGKRENFYVDYYVAGIGRYKQTTPNGDLTLEVLSDQSFEANPPAVK